ncbi:MAG: ABC transporter permease [Bacteroidota bacterium]
MILSFSVRDTKIHYAQTILGVFWIVLQPLLAVIIYTVFFKNWIQLSTGNVPYPVFVISGFMLWQYFSFIVINSGNSLIQNQRIVTKVSFPKLVPVISTALTGMLSLIVSFIILKGLFIYYGISLKYQFFFFPVIVVLTSFVGLSIGIWLSALTFRHRDLYHFATIIIGYGIWFTPVFFPTTLIPAKYDILLYINPVTGLIECFRWTLFGGELPSINYLYGIIPVVVLFLTGLFYFNKVEKHIADII